MPLSIGDCTRNSTRQLSNLHAEQQARVDAERGGGLRQLISIEVEARPTGSTWSHNPARPGPLDGQPECRHYTIARYSDGSVQEWGPMARAGG